MLLSINLPTNDPVDYFSILEPSIDNLKPLLNYCNVEFSFVFQYPWTPSKAIRAKENLISKGFGFKMSTATAKKTPSMCYLRNKSMENSPNADYYMIIDDNFKFGSGTPKYPYSSGERYAQCLKYLEKYQKCGFVMCEGSLGGSVQKLEISSTKVGLFATTRGLILRNIGSEFIYGGSTGLLGGLEESVACYNIIGQGYFPAKQFNNPTLNVGMAKPDSENSSIHDVNLWNENCAKYIKEKFGDPDWNYQKKRLPEGLKKTIIANFGKKITTERIFRHDY